MLYDDPSVTYDDEELLYDGIELDPARANLIVADVDVSSALQHRGLSVTAKSQGDERGTLTAKLLNAAVTPAEDDPVRLYIGTADRFRGTVRRVLVTDRPAAPTLVELNANDDGPTGELPTPAAFALSDEPDGVTSIGYDELTTERRTTDGSPKRSVIARVLEHGLWANQNVLVTSARQGMAAEELTITEVHVNWETFDPDELPVYRLVLGEPLVSLGQVVREHEIPDGSITETKISDGAISTPKLAANAVTAEKIEAGAVETDKLAADAVIANVANVGGNVTIDATGIVIESPGGTVIIDGTSNVFKIQASGSLSLSLGAGWVQTSSTVTLTGLGAQATIPAHVSYVATTTSPGTLRYLGWHNVIGLGILYAGTSNGATSTTGPIIGLYSQAAVRTYLDGSSQCVVALGGENSQPVGYSYYAKYHVLKEAAL